MRGYKKNIATFFGFALLFTPSLSLAAGDSTNVKLENPLAFDSFVEFLSAILDVVVIIAVPIIIFFFVYAGFLYVTARGNSEQVGKATNAILYAVIGGMLILGAQALSVIIKNTVDEFSSDSTPSSENSGSAGSGGSSDSSNSNVNNPIGGSYNPKY